jgi:acetyl-CoA/propionyl-CoA carboxylase biotin carboxyl carrier protein
MPSPLQGVVLRRAVEDGAPVETGALVLVVEAMKMENEIAAHRPGVVSNLVQVGATVGVGDRLFTVESTTGA